MWTLFIPGLVFTVLGIILVKWPPRTINIWYGFRSRRSVRSQEAWDDVNRLSGLLFLVAGFLSINASITCWLFGFQWRNALIIIGCANAILVAAVLVVTNWVLVRAYDEGGRRRRTI